MQVLHLVPVVGMRRPRGFAWYKRVGSKVENDGQKDGSTDTEFDSELSRGESEIAGRQGSGRSPSPS